MAVEPIDFGFKVPIEDPEESIPEFTMSLIKLYRESPNIVRSDETDPADQRLSNGYYDLVIDHDKHVLNYKSKDGNGSEDITVEFDDSKTSGVTRIMNDRSEQYSEDNDHHEYNESIEYKFVNGDITNINRTVDDKIITIVSDEDYTESRIEKEEFYEYKDGKLNGEYRASQKETGTVEDGKTHVVRGAYLNGTQVGKWIASEIVDGKENITGATNYPRAPVVDDTSFGPPVPVGTAAAAIAL
jgi:hypothetical protein